MGFATAYMVPFANDAVVVHNYSAHHGIWRGSLLALTGKLKAAEHVFLHSKFFS